MDLPNCDNVKGALVLGNQVIVSKDHQPGEIGLYFPLETALSAEFLGGNNLFRHAQWGNKDPLKVGFFEEHGRVKAVRFRGHKSEGFWIPLDAIGVMAIDYEGVLVPGAEFDTINNKEVCRKYVRKGTKTPGTPGVKGVKKVRVEDAIVDGQLRLHYDTAQLRRNAHQITPESIVSISDKWHGTSVVIGNLLLDMPCPNELQEKTLGRLMSLVEGRAKKTGWLNTKIQKTALAVHEFLNRFVEIKREYGLVVTSRNVVKYAGKPQKGAQHYYAPEAGGADIWTQVGKEIEDRLPKGFTVYGEIVGYTPGGKAIQSMKNKAFHYGCPDNTHALKVYRVTFTNEDGKVFELHWKHMLQFCFKYGLDPVIEEYYGSAMDFVLQFHPNAVTKEVDGLEIRGPWAQIKSAKLADKAWKNPIEPELPENHDPAEPNFAQLFLEAVEGRFLEQMCKHNRSEVPREGVVIRIDELEQARAFKSKSFMFFEWETKAMDSGESDMETEESVGE
jgi:hypothetical protein